MLPASDLTAILTNLASLQLEPNTTAQILAAVLAPLLRADPARRVLPRQRASRPRVRPRRAAQQKRKKTRPRVADAEEPIEAAKMIHVGVRYEGMAHAQKLARRQRCQIAEVEQKRAAAEAEIDE